MSYRHLTPDERYQISAYKQMGMGPVQIADEIGRNKSTVSRELKRNVGGRGYRPKQAQELAINRLKTAPKRIKMTKELIEKIEEKILQDWSPEQISGRLLREEGISISHETIYQHILTDKVNGGDLHTHLRCQKKRKRRYGSKSHDRRGEIKDRVDIEKRPQVVETKERIGDWEGDTVIGKGHKGALVTLVDRKSKHTLIAKVETKEASVVAKAVKELLEGERVHTITFDNGKEFAFHKEMAAYLDAKIYFAHPYSSWERGLNENTNGLIRQYFKKGSSFDGVDQSAVNRVMDAINNRPRKSLGYLTPLEIYSGMKRLPKVALVT